MKQTNIDMNSRGTIFSPLISKPSREIWKLDVWKSTVWTKTGSIVRLALIRKKQS